MTPPPASPSPPPARPLRGETGSGTALLWGATCVAAVVAGDTLHGTVSGLSPITLQVR